MNILKSRYHVGLWLVLAAPAQAQMCPALGELQAGAISPVEQRTCDEFLFKAAKEYEKHLASRIAAAAPRLERLIANARHFHQTLNADARIRLGAILDSLGEIGEGHDGDMARALRDYWLRKTDDILGPAYETAAPFARSGDCPARSHWKAPVVYQNAANALDGYCSRGSAPDEEFLIPDALWTLFWGYSRALGTPNRRALVGAACYGDFHEAYIIEDRRLVEPACVLFDLEAPAFVPIGTDARSALLQPAYGRDLELFRGVAPTPGLEEWQRRRARAEKLGFCVGDDGPEVKNAP